MVKETKKFDWERRVWSKRFDHFWSVPEGDIGYLLALAGRYKPPTRFCHKLHEVAMESQSRAPHFLGTGHFIHSWKHAIELVKYSRKCVHKENKELELQAPLPCPEESWMSPQDERLLLNHKKMPGFLASEGEEFNLGPETRLDCSELLCNKVLLKYKRDRESFWHRHWKGDGECPLVSVSNGVIYLLISYYNESKECLKFVKILPDPLLQFTF